MTPSERYAELRDMTSNFAQKNMINNHFLRHLREAIEEDRATRCADDLYRSCYERGRREALAEAARMVHESPTDCDHQALAESIRAKGEAKNENG